MELLAGNS